MKAIWKLFVGDVKRLTSNVVSVIIVIGLTVLPALFTWPPAGIRSPIPAISNSPSRTSMPATKAI